MSTTEESLGERKMRIKYYMGMTRLNTNFLMVYVAVVILGQLFFNSSGKIYLWLLPLLVVILFFLLQAFLVNRLNHKFRKIDSNMMDSARSIRSIIVVPLMIMLSLRITTIMSDHPDILALVSGIVIVSVLSLVYFLLPGIHANRIIANPQKYPRLDQAKYVEIKRRLPESIPDVTVAITRKKGKWFANAYCIGYRKPVVEVTEYMEANLTVDQLSAVVAHELGHYVRGDNLVLGRNYSAFIYGYFILLVILSYFETGLIIPFYLSAYVAFYFLFRHNTRIQRSMELRADIFAAKSGLADELKSALVKVDDLNFIPSDAPESWGKSHPSTVMRLNFLEQNNF